MQRTAACLTQAAVRQRSSGKDFILETMNATESFAGLNHRYLSSHAAGSQDHSEVKLKHLRVSSPTDQDFMLFGKTFSNLDRRQSTLQGARWQMSQVIHQRRITQNFEKGRYGNPSAVVRK